MNAPVPPQLDPHVSVLRQLEPNVFEVAVLYPFGASEQAMQDAAALVAQLLAAPALGPATAETPDSEDISDRVATTQSVHSAFAILATALSAQLEAALTAKLQGMVADGVADVLQTPGGLAGLLPDTLPDTPETAWLNGGVMTVTPKA